MECGSLSDNVEVDEEKKEAVKMKVTQEKGTEGFVDVSKMLEEMKKDLPSKKVQVAERKAPTSRQAILQILARAADDHKFLARLAENPGKVLEEYDLTWEEKAALASGDLRRIELWVGKLDERLSTWIWCRLQQEKW
jgi:hypothetical protein